jgi:hypothetical protein
MNDLQFLTGPVIGDVLGQGTQQVIGGSASLDLAAYGFTGQPASAGWPKLTGDWTIATPTLGSFGSLANKVVVSITRSGTLAVYSTPAPACSPSSWPRFHHDVANSGDYTRDAVPPGRPGGLRLLGSTLSFTAPGGDLMCGRAASYQVVTSARPITYANFASARRLPGASVPAAAGSVESFALSAGVARYVAVRAIDGAGNLGLPAVLRAR